MSLKIRLSRGGAKKRPFYRIVVADCAHAARRPLHRKDRHLRSLEGQGRRRPPRARSGEGQSLDRQGRAADRSRARLLDGLGVIKREARNNPQKAQPKKKAQERAAAAAEAAGKAAEAPAA